MVKIILDTGVLDVRQDVSFPLTFSVGEIRDITKRTGTFSKTIVLAGTDNNNQLLNHYYDVNIDAGTFDVSQLTYCQVTQNDVVIMENAVLQLISVNKSQLTDAHEQVVNYEVLIKDPKAELFTAITNAELTDLDFSDLNHFSNSTSIIASFGFTQANGYKYVLPYDTDALYNVRQIKPAIYAKTYFDRIFANAGFTYTWTDLQNARFDKLLIPYNGDENQIDWTDYKVLAENTYTTTNAQPATGSFIPFWEQLDNWTEILDTQGIFDPVTGEYTAPTDVDPTASQSYEFKFNITYNIVFNNTGANPVRPVFYNTTLGAYASQMQNNLHYWQTAGGVNTRVDVNIDITDIKLEIIPNSNTQPIGGFVTMNQYVPVKIKQSDFVKSVFQMYNLYVDVDPNQPNNIILTHRDEYYDNGTQKDWTYKLAKDREQNLEFLPDVSNKRLILTYKQDNDTPNTLYFEATREIYGQQEYIFNSEYVKDVDTKELIFSPTPIAQTTFGAVVPMIDGQAPKTNIRILYDGGEQPCGSYDIIDGGVTGTYGVTTYPAITHFDNALTPSFDINFGTCDFYYYNPQTLTNNTLYNLYWRRTINQINEGKMLTAFFKLTENDIHGLKLSDKIRIDNSWWNINRVIDYNANTEGLTKVELISADSELELAPFISNTGNPTPSPTTEAALDSVLRSSTISGNVILEGAQVSVYGRGNTIAQGVRGIVIGNGQTLDEDGIITPRINGAAAQTSTYVANLTQVGTNAPTAIELSNNIGPVTWTRTLQGQYLGTPTTPFEALYTFVMINSNEHDHLCSAFINTDGDIVVKTTNTQNHQHNDDILNNTTLEIRIY